MVLEDTRLPVTSAWLSGWVGFCELCSGMGKDILMFISFYFQPPLLLYIFSDI